MLNRFPLLATLALFVAVPTAALAQSTDVDTFSSRVPPNVVILLASSPTTGHHMWDDDFDHEKLYPGVCGWAAAPTKPGTSCPGKGNPSDLCPNNEYVDVGGGVPHVVSVSTSHTCTLSVGGGGPPVTVTRDVYGEQGGQNKQIYSLNYLNWLFGVATSTELANEPQVSRIMVARKTILDAIYATNVPPKNKVDFGVADFSADNGARIRQPINPSSTQSIDSSVNAIKPEAAAPLSEALVDIGRYYAHELESLGGGYATFDTGPDMIVNKPCAMNFVIILSDGASTEDQNNHHGSSFMDLIGNYDRDANECDPDVGPGHDPTCADSTASASYSPMLGRDDGETYLNNGSDWLDDVAKFLYETDVRPTTIAGQQNVITYTIGFINDSPLLKEAALNSTGEYYYAGPGSGSALSQALLEAINAIIERATSFSSVAVPTARTQLGDALYTGYFLPSRTDPFWQGHLESYRLRPDGVIENVDGNPATDSTGAFPDPRRPYWDAGLELLNGGKVTSSGSTRNLLTTVSGSTTPFTVSNSTVTAAAMGLTDPNEIATYPNYPASGVATLANVRDAIIDYIHGYDAFDEDEDGLTNDLREWILGDIFHSTPLVVAGAPRVLIQEEGYGHSASGTPFYDLYKERDRVVYAGANDGLLHAFNGGEFHAGDNAATTGITEDGYYDMGDGVERFGYMPAQMLAKVRKIPTNTPRAHYFMDGNPVVADAWFPADPNDTVKEPAEWATVLISGMRQGGNGYIALDVTDPDVTNSSDPHYPYPKLLWEFSDSDLGESWSTPVIVRVKVRGPSGLTDHCGDADGDGDCREHWVAIFGGGYDERGDPNLTTYVEDPNDAGWTDRSKAIFMVSMETGQVLASVRHDPAGISGPDEMEYSIPSDPLVLDLDFDGFADVVYIGDTGGRVWKWDISNVGEDSDFDGTVDNWISGLFFESDPVSMGGGVDHYRSFYRAGSAAFNKNQDLIIVLGTGERTDLEYEGDATKDDNNRFYAIIDAHPTGGSAFPGELDESDLTDISGLDSDTDFSDSGFFFRLPESQKSITAHTIFGGQVITTGYMPDLGNSSTPCATAGGQSFLYVFDLVTGLGYYTDSVTTGDAARYAYIGPGAPSDPRITIGPDGNTIYVQTSTGGILPLPPPPPNFDPVEIVYWRQNF